MEQGIYNISFEEYKALDCINASYLKVLAELPARAQLPWKDTPDMKFGRALHCYVLDGKKEFYNQFAIIGVIDKRTKAGKEQYGAFVMENQGKEIISHLEYGVIIKMHEAIMNHPFAKEIMAEGQPEGTVIWQDEATGLWCKARPDWHVPKYGAIYDLKTTKNADKWIFRSDMKYRKYWYSAAFYQEGLQIVTGQRYDFFAFIACEKVAPYRVEVYTLPDAYLEAGHRHIHHWLAKEVEYRKDGFWPHYKNPGADELPMDNYLEGEPE